MIQTAILTCYSPGRELIGVSGPGGGPARLLTVRSFLSQVRIGSSLRPAAHFCKIERSNP